MVRARMPRRTSSPSTSQSRRTRARPSSRCRKTTRLPRSTSGTARVTAPCARWATRTTAPDAACHQHVRMVDAAATGRLHRRRPEDPARRILRARLRGHDAATASSSSSRTPTAGRTRNRPASCGPSCCRTSRRRWCASRSIRPTATFELTQRIPLQASRRQPAHGLAEHGAVRQRQPAVQRRSAGRPLRQRARRSIRWARTSKASSSTTDDSFWMVDEYRPAIYHFDRERPAAAAVRPDRHACRGRRTGARAGRRRRVRHRGVAGGARAAPAEPRLRGHRAPGRQDLRLRAKPDPQSRHAGQRAR